MVDLFYCTCIIIHFFKRMSTKRQRTANSDRYSHVDSVDQWLESDTTGTTHLIFTVLHRGSHILRSWMVAARLKSGLLMNLLHYVLKIAFLFKCILASLPYIWDMLDDRETLWQLCIMSHQRLLFFCKPLYYTQILHSKQK